MFWKTRSTWRSRTCAVCSSSVRRTRRAGIRRRAPLDRLSRARAFKGNNIFDRPDQGRYFSDHTPLRNACQVIPAVIGKVDGEWKDNLTGRVWDDHRSVENV